MADLIDRQAAIDAMMPIYKSASLRNRNVFSTARKCMSAIEELPSAQPDMSEYSDKLWKKAYERGKAEALAQLEEAYISGETEAEARYHAQQRWIPCSERLPEPRMAVLGYAPRYQNIYALYYDSAYGWMVWSPVRDDFFPNSQGEIIAWMPLPEPYKEDK